MKTKILLASIFTAVLFLTVSCGNDDPKIPAPETFSLITSDATDVGVGGATLNGGYNADQAQYVSKLGFAYRASNGTTWAEAEVTGTDSPFSTTLTGLNSGQQYVYYAFIKLKNSNDIIKGAEKVFSCTAPTLTVNPEALNFNANGNSAQTVTVTCDADSWTVTADSWITISDKTATSFKVNVNDNTTYYAKTGEVIVSVGSLVSKTVTINVAAAKNPAIDAFIGTYDITAIQYTFWDDVKDRLPVTYVGVMDVDTSVGTNALRMSNGLNQNEGSFVSYIDFIVDEDGFLVPTEIDPLRAWNSNWSYTYAIAKESDKPGYVSVYNGDVFGVKFNTNNQLAWPSVYEGVQYYQIFLAINPTSGDSGGVLTDLYYDVVMTKRGSGGGISPASVGQSQSWAYKANFNNATVKHTKVK